MPESQHSNTKLNECSTDATNENVTWHNNTQHLDILNNQYNTMIIKLSVIMPSDILLSDILLNILLQSVIFVNTAFIWDKLKKIIK